MRKWQSLAGCSTAMSRFPPDGFAATMLWCSPTGPPRDSLPLDREMEHDMRIGIATDHGGFALKEELLAHLRAERHDVVDFGAHGLTPGDDYPDFVIPLAHAVIAGKIERGVAICGSGVGASVWYRGVCNGRVRRN